jgi:hypothetical protein
MAQLLHRARLRRCESRRYPRLRTESTALLARRFAIPERQDPLALWSTTSWKGA